MTVFKIVLGLMLLLECYHRWLIVSYCRAVNKEWPHPETMEFALTLCLTIAYVIAVTL